MRQRLGIAVPPVFLCAALLVGQEPGSQDAQCQESLEEAGIDEEDSDLSSMLQLASRSIPSGGRAAAASHLSPTEVRRVARTTEDSQGKSGSGEEASGSASDSAVLLQLGEEISHKEPSADVGKEDAAQRPAKGGKANAAQSTPGHNGIWVGSVKATKLGLSSGGPDIWADLWDTYSVIIKVGSGCLALILLLSWAIGRRVHRHFKAPSPIRDNVEKLRVASWEDIKSRLPTAVHENGVAPAGTAPQQQQPIRLEARIEGATDDASEVLTAPLSKKDCVIFKVMVSKQLEGNGVPPEPVAFKCKAVSFWVSPLDAPAERIKVSGEEIALFDMCRGLASEKSSLSAAPPHWQDFVLAHKGSHVGVKTTACGGSLKFEECALFVGSTITLVGEPCVDADGAIQLVAGTAGLISSPSQEVERSSPKTASLIQEVLFANVLASDDVELLHYWRPGRRRLRALCKSALDRLVQLAGA